MKKFCFTVEWGKGPSGSAEELAKTGYIRARKVSKKTEQLVERFDARSSGAEQKLLAKAKVVLDEKDNRVN